MRGYDTQQVDSYLTEVKKVFETKNFASASVTSSDLRNKSFDLKRKGYDPRYVDSALDRLEELFFENEKQQFFVEYGAEEWNRFVAELVQELLGRMTRPKNERFKKTNILAHGYRRSQVDAALDQISKAFRKPGAVKPSQIRQVRFYAQRGGYDEAQVDAYLDSLVEYLLATKPRP